MGVRAKVERSDAGVEFARLLADETAGRAGAEVALSEWLRIELESLLQRRLAPGARLSMADAGALVQQHWAQLSLVGGPADAGAKRRKGTRARTGQSTRQEDGGAPGRTGDDASSAEAAARFARYIERATGTMRQAVADLVARAGVDASGATPNPSPAARALHGLEGLATLEPRLARTACLRWFGGLDAEAVALLLGEDRVEVQRRWYVARAFLAAAVKGSGAPGRARGKAPASVSVLPDTTEWARLALLFETGSDLAGEVRASWLESRRAEASPTTMHWLRGMLAAADAPESDKAIERGPRLPAWTERVAAEGAPAQEASQVPEPPGAPPAVEPQAVQDLPPRATAPALATGMRLGPWLLLGPMTSSDARVSQWRVRRAIEDPPGPEVALLVPHQWRPAPDLHARLAQAAAPARSLAHPHIAHLIDAGIAEDGTPWLCAELAEGQPIDRWCRDRSLEVHERRRLMEQALEAARFAHGRLVLHGRVHPSQIVVTPEGRLRWLNFGLSTLLTLLDVPPPANAPAGGSPPASAYLAPEHQARAAEATDSSARVSSAASFGAHVLNASGEVHALGLVLFEVLSGASPWQPPSPGEASQLATGTHWRRPSDLAATAKVRRALRGDLDAIVAKATQIDPTLRYATAAELLDELQRAGSHRPVAAREGSFGYGAARLVRRHAVLASACMVLLTASLLALAGLSWKSWQWTHERDEAISAWRGSEAVTRLMLDLLHERAGLGQEQNLSRWLAHAESVARTSLKDQPASLGSALALLGRQHAEDGAFAEGRNLLAEALPMLGGQAQLHEARCDEAWARARQGDKAAEAEKRIRREAESPVVRPVSRTLCLARLADLERRSGRPRDAYQTTHLARAKWNESIEKPPQLAVLLGKPMGALSASLGRYQEAQSWIQWAMTQLEAMRQTQGPAGIELREQLGELLLAAGDAQGAQKAADANMVALTGSELPADVDAAVAPPVAMYYAAAEPRLELHQLSDARLRLDRALALAMARQNTTMVQRVRCMLSIVALRESDGAAAEGLLKLTPLEGVSWLGHTTSRPPIGASGANGNAPSAAPAELDDADRAAVRETDQVCRAARIELALVQGRPSEAHREAERLLASGDELSPRLRASVSLLRADAALAAGQKDRMLAPALQSLQQARTLQDSDAAASNPRRSFRSGQAALVLAEAHRANGDIEEAKKTLDYAMQQLSATLPEAHPWRRRAEVAKAALAVHAAKKP